MTYRTNFSDEVNEIFDNHLDIMGIKYTNEELEQDIKIAIEHIINEKNKEIEKLKYHIYRLENY